MEIIQNCYFASIFPNGRNGKPSANICFSNNNYRWQILSLCSYSWNCSFLDRKYSHM